LRQRTHARAHALVGWLSWRLDSSVRLCGRARGVAGVGVVYQICLSISGRCSLAEVVFSVTPRRSVRRHSNSLSISAVCIVKPRCVYISKNFFRELVRLALLWVGTYTEVVNFTPLELVIMNPIPSTNMTSAVIVISLLMSTISCGTLI
jgi:hypothetical protein